MPAKVFQILELSKENLSINEVVLQFMFYGAKILFTSLILLIVFTGFSQPVKLSIVFTDTVLKEILKPQEFLSEPLLKKHLQNELIYWQKQNFLEASFDSIVEDSNYFKAYLRVGKQYKIYVPNNTSKKRNKKGEFSNSTHYTYWLKSIQNTIGSLEQNGYPFALVIVKNSAIANHEIQLNLTIDSGQYITYDTLIITGTSLQDKLFMMQYLNIKPNKAYNEEDIRQLDKRLQQLPFIRVARPSSVYFYKNKAQVIICIDDKPSNNFEGIAGIRNDELNAKKYKVTGDVNLQLNNVLSSAASLKLQWRRFAAQNSDLNAMAYYPYILGAPIAISNEFNLFRQDSNFQRLKNNIGFSYLYSGLNGLQFYYTYEKSTATLTDQQLNEAVNSNNLPSVNDYLNKNYGIKLTFNNFDNPYNPTRGLNLIADISAGSHKLLQNSVLKDSRNGNGKLYEGYDSLTQQQTSLQTYNRIDYFYPLSKRNVLNLFAQGASMYHPNLFYNEQFQLGGLKTFRGVNELSIKATTYLMLRTEYRYLLPQTGYFNLFCNGIWYESNIVNSYKNKALLGFGAGLGIQTKGGIISVVYALANENGFILKLGKVHIGFTAVF